MGRPDDYVPPIEPFKPADIKMETVEVPDRTFKYDESNKVKFGTGEKKSLLVKLNKQKPQKSIKVEVKSEKSKKETAALHQKLSELERNRREAEKSQGEYQREIEQLREQVKSNPRSEELAARLEHEKNRFMEIENKMRELKAQSQLETDKVRKELQEHLANLRNEKIALEKNISEREREYEAKIKQVVDEKEREYEEKIEETRHKVLSQKEQMELQKLALEIENQKIKQFKQMEEINKANAEKVKTEKEEVKPKKNEQKPTNINLINDARTKYDPIILPYNIADDPINITNQFLTDHGYKIAGTAAGLYLSYKIYKYLNFFGQSRKKKKVIA